MTQTPTTSPEHHSTATVEDGRRSTVSVVVPMLNEAENIPMLVERMKQICTTNPEHDFEFVVVDDGSTDGGLELLLSIKQDLCVNHVALARNFGSHAALSAGFRAATGDSVIMLGADLQEPLSLIRSLLDKHNDGFDVVWAIRSERASGGFFARTFAKVFWFLLHKYSGVRSYPAQGPSVALCDRVVVDAVNAMDERNRSILLLIAWVGFKSTTVEFVQERRNAGQSKWSTGKLIKLAVDALVQFSTSPIRAMSYIGSTFAMLGFLYAVFLLFWAIISNSAPAGWTTVVVIVLILGGIQLLMLGVLGEYLWRATDEARQRPLFVVDPRRSAVIPGMRQSSRPLDAVASGASEADAK